MTVWTRQQARELLRDGYSFAQVERLTGFALGEKCEECNNTYGVGPGITRHRLGHEADRARLAWLQEALDAQSRSSLTEVA